MREYKFRGLRLDGRGWAYGDLVHMASGAVHIVGRQIGEPWLGQPVDAKTVGQWTGVKDGATDVYQHDIWDDIYIDLCDKCASMQPHDLDTRTCLFCEGELAWSDIVHGFRKGYAKIDGNIHEAAK